jgi:hypothetical protein
LHEIRQYGLKEIYPGYMIRRKEEREGKKMGGGRPFRNCGAEEL